MPLYVTDRISEVDVEYNSKAKFIYFDTIKKDSLTASTLLLRDKNNTLPIRHRNNMSNTGEWDDEDFEKKYKPIVSKDFKNVSLALRNADLVIFPIRVFNIVLFTLNSKIHDFFQKKFKELIKINEV